MQRGCHLRPYNICLSPEEVALLVRLLAQHYRGREQAGTTGGPCYAQAKRLHAAFVALQREQEEAPHATPHTP